MTADSMSRLEIFEASRLLWGISAQIHQLAEEAAELSVAALHMDRKTKDPDKSLYKLAKEVADVEFMLEEIKYYLLNRKFNNDHLYFLAVVETFRHKNIEYVTELITRECKTIVENIPGYTLRDFLNELNQHLANNTDEYYVRDWLGDAANKLHCPNISVKPE